MRRECQEPGYRVRDVDRLDPVETLDAEYRRDPYKSRSARAHERYDHRHHGIAYAAHHAYHYIHHTTKTVKCVIDRKSYDAGLDDLRARGIQRKQPASQENLEIAQCEARHDNAAETADHYSF